MAAAATSSVIETPAAVKPGAPAAAPAAARLCTECGKRPSNNRNGLCGQCIGKRIRAGKARKAAKQGETAAEPEAAAAPPETEAKGAEEAARPESVHTPVNPEPRPSAAAVPKPATASNIGQSYIDLFQGSERVRMRGHIERGKSSLLCQGAGGFTLVRLPAGIVTHVPFSETIKQGARPLVAFHFENGPGVKPQWREAAPEGKGVTHHLILAEGGNSEEGEATDVAA